MSSWNTLGEIASAIAPGSELVVQFMVPAATLSREEGNLVCAAAARAASMGEMTTQERANVVSVASGARSIRMVFTSIPRNDFRPYDRQRPAQVRKRTGESSAWRAVPQPEF